MTDVIGALSNRHLGETAWIVGRGPSLLGLAREAFGNGPVIALNYALVWVRALHLPNPIYSMQKDGCYPATDPIGHRQPCGDCRTGPLVVAPEMPETLLVSIDESPHCFADYPQRYVFDVVADLGCRRRSNMSAPVAVRIARLMGVSNVVMLGHDAFVNGDPRFVEYDGRLRIDSESPLSGYLQGAEHANAFARETGMAITWA